MDGIYRICNALKRVPDTRFATGRVGKAGLVRRVGNAPYLPTVFSPVAWW